MLSSIVVAALSASTPFVVANSATSLDVVQHSCSAATCLADASHPTPLTEATSQPPPPQRHTLAWVGGGVGAASVALLAGSLYYHLKAEDTYSKTQAKDSTGRLSSSQPVMLSLVSEYNSETNRRNTMLVVGAILAVGGGAMVALDFAWLGKPTPSVSVGPSAAAASLTWSL